MITKTKFVENIVPKDWSIIIEPLYKSKGVVGITKELGYLL